MVVVTGAAGFIGSNLVLELNRRGHDDVLAVDVLQGVAQHRNLNRAHIRDLVDPESFLAHLDSLGPVECVFHNGACSDTTATDGRFVMRNNYEYTKTLLEWCMRQGVRCIYASSASVYGNGEQGFREERSAEYPLNLYAYSKFLLDQWVRRHQNEFSKQLVGLRYFNVYGPQENHKERMASVVWHFHQQILRDGKIKLFEGSENFLRDFVFVNDIVDVNMHFFEHPQVSGLFNAGTGRARSFMDIARIMAAHHKNVEIEFVPFPADLRGRYQAFTQADLTALLASGYAQEPTSLEEGVATYAAILEKREGYW